MQGYILAFAIGAILLQQQAELPELLWAGTLLPLAISIFLLFRYQITLPVVIGRTLPVILFLAGGFFWAAAFAQWRLADALPHEWEGRDIQLVGVVAELPQASESGVRFAFDVEQVLTRDAVVPERIPSSGIRKVEDQRVMKRGRHRSTPASAGS